MNADKNLLNLRNGSAALTTSLLIFVHGGVTRDMDNCPENRTLMTQINLICLIF
jgi:hypothetical protein